LSAKKVRSRKPRAQNGKGGKEIENEASREEKKIHYIISLASKKREQRREQRRKKRKAAHEGKKTPKK